MIAEKEMQELVEKFRKLKKAMADKPKEIGSLPIQTFKGNDHVTIVIGAYQSDERAFTITSDSFTALLNHWSELNGKEQGHALLSFARYDDTVPMEDDEE